MIKPSQTPPHIVTLAMAAAISPLAMNIYLPSLPGLADHFQTTPAKAQLSVSLFLASTAILQLLFGPLSDRYGRRPVLLYLLCIMLGATVLCIFAPNMTVFLIGRALQASAAAGLVLSRAIVRDQVPVDQAASMIGYVTMGMTLAPMLGPIIGGFLDESYGWQASFWVVFAFTTLTIVVAWFDLGETNKNTGAPFSSQFQVWPELLSSRRFWGYAACCAFSSGAFFAFLGAGALIASQYFKLAPSQFGFYFLFIAIGYMLGNFIAGRFSVRLGLNNMMIMGNVFAAAGLSIALILNVVFPNAALAFFGLIFFVGLGNGITLPNANAGIVNVRPSIAGAASGLGASLQIGGGAALAILTGYIISTDEGPFTLLIIMITSIACAIASSLYVIHIEKQISKEAQNS